MKEEFEIQDISDDELNYYLLSLRFIINSNGCRYLKSAIWYYYYYPNKFNSLDRFLNQLQTNMTFSLFYTIN